MIIISFIVPVFNAEKYLKQCFNSIIEQNITNYEIIIINDCSTDNSLSIIYEYIHLKQIQVINNSKNQGVSACRNKGIKYSKGKYLFFIDCDDFIVDNKLKSLESIIKSNKILDIILFNHNKSSDGHLNIDSGIYNTDQLINVINNLDYFIGYCWRFIIKKEYIIKNNILFTDVKTHEDEEFITYLLCFSKYVYYYNEQVYCHRFNVHGLSGSKDHDSTIGCLLIIERLIALYGDSKISVEQKLFIISRIELLIKYFIPRLFFRNFGELLIISSKFNKLNDALLKHELSNHELFNMFNPTASNKLNYLINSIENDLCHLIDGNTNKDLYVFCVGLQGEAVNRILLKKDIHIKGFLDNNIVYEHKIIGDVSIYQPIIFINKAKKQLSNIFVIICNQRNEHYLEIFDQLINLNINRNNICRFIF
jgi:glycosyltransferase involved in cell wall biosynthesis